MASEETTLNNGEDREIGDVEMSFLDHIEELRWRIIYSLIGVLIFTIAAWIFIDPIIEVVLLKPARDANAPLQNLRPFGQLFLYVQVAIIVGIVASLPNIFYQLWQFITPALKETGTKIYSLDSFLFYFLFSFRNCIRLLCYASSYNEIRCPIWHCRNCK